MRRLVIERAGRLCEYCLIHQDLAASYHQIDHILAEKHGGKTTTDNLALSCTLCSRRKVSDISSVDPESGEVVSLFNPRTQHWSDHFRVENVRFVGTTPEGRTTVEFLRMNSFTRLVERDVMIRAGVFPLD